MGSLESIFTLDQIISIYIYKECTPTFVHGKKFIFVLVTILVFFAQFRYIVCRHIGHTLGILSSKCLHYNMPTKFTILIGIIKKY